MLCCIAVSVLNIIHINSTVFRTVMLCGLEKAWCFRGTYQLHFQGWTVNKARNQQERGHKQSSSTCWFFAWLSHPKWGCNMLFSNNRLYENYTLLWPRKWYSSYLILSEPQTQNDHKLQVVMNIEHHISLKNNIISPLNANPAIRVVYEGSVHLSHNARHLAKGCRALRW